LLAVGALCVVLSDGLTLGSRAFLPSSVLPTPPVLSWGVRFLMMRQALLSLKIPVVLVSLAINALAAT
jgi:hypothetical protein